MFDSCESYIINRMGTAILNKNLFIGILFALPFFILNALVVSGVSILKILRPEGHTTGYEQIFILGLLSLVFIGGVVSLYPAMKARRLMVLNVVVGVLLVGFSVVAGYGLGSDVYHCDILRIPNCD